MPELDQLLNIPDPRQRIEALLQQARTLGINPIQAQNSRGKYSEEKLVLLIFDATHNIRRNQRKNVHFASGVFVVAIVILSLMLLLPRMAQFILSDDLSVQPDPPKTYKAYDEKGRPVTQEQQPVLFELMEGTYQQFDDNGRLKYEMDYVAGELVRKREFAPDGSLLKERTYAEPEAAEEPLP